MAITNEVTKQAASIKLQDGQTSSGALKLVSVSIGTLSSNPSNLDTQKIMNIVLRYLKWHVQKTTIICCILNMIRKKMMATMDKIKLHKELCEELNQIYERAS